MSFISPLSSLQSLHSLVLNGNALHPTLRIAVIKCYGKYQCPPHAHVLLVISWAQCLALFSFPYTLTFLVVLYLHMVSPSSIIQLNTQRILSFSPHDSQISSWIFACVNGISFWMTVHYLKLKPCKTELLYISEDASLFFSFLPPEKHNILVLLYPSLLYIVYIFYPLAHVHTHTDGWTKFQTFTRSFPSINSHLNLAATVKKTNKIYNYEWFAEPFESDIKIHEQDRVGESGFVFTVSENNLGAHGSAVFQ